MTGTFHPSEDCTCGARHSPTEHAMGCPLDTERGRRNDPVNHPPHYTSHPSGVECITVTEWFGFNVGNAIKYLWRAGEKGDPIVDLEKAAWYVDREIQRLTWSRSSRLSDGAIADGGDLDKLKAALKAASPRSRP